MKTAYERIVQIMRTQGELKNVYIEPGEMQSRYTCKKGDLFLESDDLMVSEELKDRLEAGDAVLLYKLSEEKYVIIAKVVDMNVSV